MNYLFEKAEKLTEWDGFVFCEELEGTSSGGYYESVTSLKEAIVNNNYIDRKDYPTYCWACERDESWKEDADYFIERTCSDLPDEVIDLIKPDSIKELQKALDKFYTANQHIVIRREDYTRAVLINWGE